MTTARTKTRQGRRGTEARARKPGISSRPFSAISLAEAVVRSVAPLKVDRDKGVIFGVKVLGLESDNGRRYTLEAIKSAVPLYEGAKVNIDHPNKPGESRSAYDRFGRLVNVVAKPDGLYADLEYLRSHPMAAQITEAAERMPDAFGLSHNAAADGHRDAQGVMIIEAITEVKHVDVVADPATTRGLSEGKQAMKRTLKQVFESSDSGKEVLAVLEMDPETPELDMDAPPETAEPGDVKKHLLDAIAVLIDSQDENDQKMVQSIMKLLKPAAPVKAEEGEGEGESGEVEKDKEEPVKKMESRIAALEKEKALLETKEFCRAECKARAVPCDESLLEGLLAIGDRKKIAGHLDYLKRVGLKAKTPRSQGPGLPVTEAKEPKDRKEFLAEITS